MQTQPKKNDDICNGIGLVYLFKKIVNITKLISYSAEYINHVHVKKRKKLIIINPIDRKWIIITCLVKPITLVIDLCFFAADLC